MNINMTLFGQLISFALFVWFAMKFVWPPLIAALEERKAKIADGLAAAERGTHAKELADKNALEQIKEAKGQAAEIIANAEKRGSEIVDEAKGDAVVEGERILTAARSEIEQESNKAKEVLRTKVGELALAGAEKILRKEINADAHKELVEALASEI